MSDKFINILGTIVGITMVIIVVGLVSCREEKELEKLENRKIIYYTQQVGDLTRYYDPELKVVCYKSRHSTNQPLSCVKL